MKTKENKITVKHGHVGTYEDMKILVVTYGSYCKQNNKEKSVAGRFIFFSNMNETKVSPLAWKSETIP